MAYIDQKLTEALRKGELDRFLCGASEYHFSTRDPNIATMNDYLSATQCLYAREQSDAAFRDELNLTIKQILDNPKPYEVYSICQIMGYQVQLEKREANPSSFIDAGLVKLLKSSIMKYQTFFESEKDFEGIHYSNGLFGFLLDRYRVIEKQHPALPEEPSELPRQQDLRILFDIQDLGGTATAYIAIHKLTGQPYSAVYELDYAGGAIGEKLTACAPVTYEKVQALALARFQAAETEHQRARYERYLTISEENWRAFL